MLPRYGRFADGSAMRICPSFSVTSPPGGKASPFKQFTQKPKYFLVGTCLASSLVAHSRNERGCFAGSFTQDAKQRSIGECRKRKAAIRPKKEFGISVWRAGKKGFDVILVGTMILLFGLMIFALVVVVYSIVWKFSQERSSRRLNRCPSGAGNVMVGSKNKRTRTARGGIQNSLAGDESADFWNFFREILKNGSDIISEGVGCGNPAR